jgi:hypothetical protein
MQASNLQEVTPPQGMNSCRSVFTKLLALALLCVHGAMVLNNPLLCPHDSNAPAVGDAGVLMSLY